MSERNEDYWEGYRASMMDLRVALSGWTATGDVEGLLELIDERLEGVSDIDSEIPFSGEPRFRATDPHGGRGKDGPFAVATSYTAVQADGKVYIVKAGLVDDYFDADQAAGFAKHLERTAARARLPSEPSQEAPASGQKDALDA